MRLQHRGYLRTYDAAGVHLILSARFRTIGVILTSKALILTKCGVLADEQSHGLL